MINDDLYEDEVMRDVWKRKAEASAMLLEEKNNPGKREERYARWRAEGFKLISPEEWAASNQSAAPPADQSTKS